MDKYISFEEQEGNWEYVMKKEIEMRFEKTIKNTYKYVEITSGIPALGILHITKSVFESKRPDTIKVTVEW